MNITFLTWKAFRPKNKSETWIVTFSEFWLLIGWWSLRVNLLKKENLMIFSLDNVEWVLQIISDDVKANAMMYLEVFWAYYYQYNIFSWEDYCSWELYDKMLLVIYQIKSIECKKIYFFGVPEFGHFELFHPAWYCPLRTGRVTILWVLMGIFQNRIFGNGWA